MTAIQAMASPTAADHLFVFVFAVLYPLLGYVNFRRLQRRVRDGFDVPRRRMYLSTVTGHWILAATAMVLWYRSGRPAESLGLHFEFGFGYVPALVIVAAAVAFLVHQLRSARSGDREYLRAVERAFGSLAILLPRSRRELDSFMFVGVTAGIVEELLWRGYLMAYLTHYLPLSVAVLLAIAGFGVAHAYQGRRALPKVTAAGAVFMLLYLLTGSLWLAVLLHVAVDVLQGRMAWVVISRLQTGRGR
ncbi:MAG: CPBP family intramembrane glutamic endopeptidase [Woeseiaceae bacterium]|nr:CPBP family intramembrane glutamic endopeptidase [Woeseiaceae bacterium]